MDSKSAKPAWVFDATNAQQKAAAKADVSFRVNGCLVLFMVEFLFTGLRVFVRLNGSCKCFAGQAVRLIMTEFMPVFGPLVWVWTTLPVKAYPAIGCLSEVDEGRKISR